MDPLDDSMLIQAARQRVLDQLRAKSEAASIINNVYGGGSDGGGVMGGMHDAAPSGGDDRDYFVDILRENLNPEDPSQGWKKSVHRYAQPKGDKSKKKVKRE